MVFNVTFLNKDCKEAGKFNTNDITRLDSVESEKGTPPEAFRFDIHTNVGRTYHLYAETAKMRSRWIGSVRSALANKDSLG